MIFDIQRFSLHDGDGIRTMIFYKGCPLRCRWCSNPEGLSFGYSIMYNPHLCKQFGDCIDFDPRVFQRNDNHGLEIRRERISEPQNIRDLCTSKALSLVGTEISTDDLLEEIARDAPFYREQGGVTLSGGEPLAQGEELIAQLEKLRERRIHVAMETSLHVPWEQVSRCISLVDTFLVDLKHTDSRKFSRFTGGDANLVITNLRGLAAAGAELVIRIPVIPGFNHTGEEMREIFDLVGTLKNIREVHLLPYHSLGAGKYRMLGMEYPFEHQQHVNEEELKVYAEYGASRGVATKING
jgi:pyruvate formate lyase activating enzyme